MKAQSQDEVRSRLGRGLAALIGDSGTEAEAFTRLRGQKRVPIGFLHPNPRNPRQSFDEDDLVELTDSVRAKGIIQPILVRTVPGKADAYEIIAGERRWRAAQRADLHDVPIVTIEADDKQALEIAIIENVQRTNLNAIEEAEGYGRLGSDYGYSQNDLAKVIGKSRSHVANTLRLLKLPERTRELLGSGQISAGHARALCNSEQSDAIAEKVVSKGLSVRAVEDLVRREQEGRERSEGFARVARREKDADTRALERRLTDKVGIAIDIRRKGESGEVRLKYASLDQLDQVVALLGG